MDKINTVPKISVDDDDEESKPDPDDNKTDNDSGTKIKPSPSNERRIEKVPSEIMTQPGILAGTYSLPPPFYYFLIWKSAVLFVSNTFIMVTRQSGGL